MVSSGHASSDVRSPLARGRAHHAPGVRCGGSRPAARPVASQSAPVWQTHQGVDLGPGRRRELRRRPDGRARQRRDDPPDLAPPGGEVATGQAMDHQPRPRGCPKQNRRDRLIRLAATHPTWALGFEDEVWWSRYTHPDRHAWVTGTEPLRLVERPVDRTDPDPKALACYGLLVPGQQITPDQMLLRFVE